MSIKSLFDTSVSEVNLLSTTDTKEIFEEVESAGNVQQIDKINNEVLPRVNYSQPQFFAKFGSAEMYYKGALDRIVNFYPYDGSEMEFNEFYHKSLGIEKYIFDSVYPRTAGYAVFDSSSYVDFKGGPHTVASTKTSQLYKIPGSSQRGNANIYDEDIYTNNGLVSDYGKGTRESNLKTNFDNGVSIEFWLKKDSFVSGEREVILDIWNGNDSSSVDYGRITLEISGTTNSPLHFTLQSGTVSSSLFQQQIGYGITTSSMADFNHYSFVFYNNEDKLEAKLYFNGTLNQHITLASSSLPELNSKAMAGRIGALLTSRSGSTENAGDDKLEASIDEFRFWKVARNAQQIGRNWKGHVRGGTNSDISNTTLGVYYKFNEGTTGNTFYDKIVLDYSGRISNGTWFGNPTRVLTSSMEIAGVTRSEFKDPIVYTQHPDVMSLYSELLESGQFYDSTNNTSFLSLFPSWVSEEHENIGNDNLKIFSHIAGCYFDKLYFQISEVSSIKNAGYVSSSYKPYPFSQHLPQHLGLYTPDFFIEANIIEKIQNKNEDDYFENNLTEIKNLLYTNLYNNISYIYKSKGTEKAIKNIYKCLGIEENIVNFNLYGNGIEFELSNNLKQVLSDFRAINFNESDNTTAVVYQKSDGSADSRGYITGSSQQASYGFTLEGDITFPTFLRVEDKFDRSNIITSSLFGVHEADVSNPEDTTFTVNDYPNMQIYSVRDDTYSKGVYFVLSSSNPAIPMLTSSTFLDVYNNERWNLSVRIRPDNYPLTNFVSGSDSFNYILEFTGLNPLLGDINNSFSITASIDKLDGEDIITASKRIYAGSHRSNITGSVLSKTDILVNKIRYWSKYVDDTSLTSHALDPENFGVTNIDRNLNSLDSSNKASTINLLSLALNWDFSSITGSDSGGSFYVPDVSSGSAEIRDMSGWLGEVAGYKHDGVGFGFPYSSTSVIDIRQLNTFKFTSPEIAKSSDNIQILSQDDKNRQNESFPTFNLVLEKSMYASISEEMYKFFAGVVDFHNIIGAPVHRYRDRYKELEKLREIFFRRVTNVSDVEKFLTYYKWFDESVNVIIRQLIPLSMQMPESSLNIVESHALERNKYQTKKPIIKIAENTFDALIKSKY